MNLSLKSQYTPCPKCKYTRKNTDIEPEYQCPRCGVIYEKYIQRQNIIQHPEKNRNNHLINSDWLPWRFSNPYLAVLVGYIVFFVVVMAIESHGNFDRAPLTPLDKILYAPIMFGLVAYGLKTGSVQGRFSTVYRSERPITFWINIKFYCLFGLFMFCWGVVDSFS